MRDDPTSDEAGMEWYVKAGEQLNEAKTLPRFKDGGGSCLGASKTFNRGKTQLNTLSKMSCDRPIPLTRVYS